MIHGYQTIDKAKNEQAQALLPNGLSGWIQSALSLSTRHWYWRGLHIRTHLFLDRRRIFPPKPRSLSSGQEGHTILSEVPLERMPFVGVAKKPYQRFLAQIYPTSPGCICTCISPANKGELEAQNSKLWAHVLVFSASEPLWNWHLHAWILSWAFSFYSLLFCRLAYGTMTIVQSLDTEYEIPSRALIRVLISIWKTQNSLDSFCFLLPLAPVRKKICQWDVI